MVHDGSPDKISKEKLNFYTSDPGQKLFEESESFECHSIQWYFIRKDPNTHKKNCYNKPEDYKYFTMNLHFWNRGLVLQRSPILSHRSLMLQADMTCEK